MTPAETAQLIDLTVSMCPAMRVGKTTAQTWHALLADTDPADAHAAVTRLSQQQRRLTAGNIRTEARAIREERLADHPLPLPEAHPDAPPPYHAQLHTIMTTIAAGQRTEQLPAAPADSPVGTPGRPRHDRRRRALHVPCPWCKAAPGHPCTVPQLGIPLKSTPAHPARLLAAGLTATSKETGW